MAYYRENRLYKRQIELWDENSLIEKELEEIAKKNQELAMEYAVLESDLIQNISCDSANYKRGIETLFLREQALDDKENFLKHKLFENKKELAQIYDDLSNLMRI